jgi:hypothetical protein
MRIMVIAVAVAALLLAATGCGGSSESAADTTATIESTDTTAVDTTGATDTSSTDTSSSSDTTSDDDASLEGCTKLTELSVKFSQALQAASGGSGAPDLQATAKAYEDFADQVPEEIRGAFKTVAAAFETYADVLKDVDLSSGATPDPDTLAKLAEAAKSLDNAKLTAATTEIEAWAKENCTGR